MKPVKHSIQTKIIAFMVVLGTMIGVGTGLAVLQTNKRELVDLEKKNMNYAVVMAGEKLHNDIRELGQDVLFLMGTPPIQGIIRASNSDDGVDPVDGTTIDQWRDHLAGIFENLLSAKGDYLKCRFIGEAENGLELVRVDQKNGIVRRIKRENLQNRGYEAFFNPDMTPGRIYLSEINLTKENEKVAVPHRPVIRASVPVFDEDRFYGQLVIDLDYQKRLNLVSRQLSEFQDVVITNQRGDYLYHQDEAKTFAWELDGPQRLQWDVKALAPFFEDTSQSEFVEYGVEDSRRLAYVQRFPFEQEADRFLVVAVSHPLKEVLLSSTRVRNRGVVIMVLTVLLSGLLAVFFSQRLVRPLRDITVAAQELAEGRFQVALPTRDHGEVGGLARALKIMTEKIEDRAQELERSEAYTRAILENALDCVITIDEKGTVITSNPAIKQMFGYEPDEVVGRNVKMLMPSPDFERHDDYLKNYLLTHVKKIIDSSRKVRGKRKDGSCFTLNLSVTELNFGEERFFTGFLKDITAQEEKRIQEARLAGLAEVMSGVKNTDQLGTRILSYMARFLDIQIGAIYLPLSDTMLRRVAVYAWDELDREKTVVKGEGLVGQAAADLQVRITENLPSGYFEIKTGMGRLAVKQIIIYPILYQNELTAILELGSLSSAHTDVKRFLDAAAHLMSITFKTSQNALTF